MSSRGKEEEGYSVEANENMLVLINNFKESLIPIGSEEANKNVFRICSRVSYWSVLYEEPATLYHFRHV